MKVLISAIACNPYLGSESHFGSSAIRALARDHELFVITTSRDRADFEKAATAGLLPTNVKYFYAGRFSPWHLNRLRARMQGWREYIDFTRDSLAVAQELHRREKFDLVHHVTYTTTRVASPMWRLGIPFVYGPVCGNEPFPFRLFPLLSPMGAAFELARKFHNFRSRISPSVRESVGRASHVFAITEEAGQLMADLRGSDKNISRLSPGFYSADQISAFSKFAPEKKTDGPLRIYVAGHLGGQKCVALAFHGLALAKKRGVKFRYHLGAGGPEIPHLKKLAVRLGLTEEIVFGNQMSRENYLRELGETHVYLLPSMRETVGLTMLEAMLAGAVPVVADNGGPRVTVTPECGYKIAVTEPRQMAQEIADAITAIDRDRKIISEKGRAASRRVAENFTEEKYRRTVDTVYRSVVLPQT
ncbi:MAG TPA: glycosyltransferase [Candidatus Sulfotelmatobacter sp.]|nr:glycosyltransferase [Candidatus Sulfotelmatobacter sp.]